VSIIDKSLAGGILYRLEGLNPIGFQVMNYMHEMGTAIQTQYVLKVPWIGATPNTLQQDATTDGIQGYVQGYGRTFAHFTGLPTTGAGVTFSQFQRRPGQLLGVQPGSQLSCRPGRTRDRRREHDQQDRVLEPHQDAVGSVSHGWPDDRSESGGHHDGRLGHRGSALRPEPDD
jgi:hypothetical protein